MRGALGGPRVRRRRLREVMAEPVSAQERLDKIVVLIAANMVAEVCSCYVLRVDGTLELYATEGLRREAVHKTVLRIDEGLVGLVASEANPVNLSDAQTHPAFAYRPETGEEIYHSFLGVPILRAGNTLGVLVVQNRARRTYTEEEVEALQTTAMVLAEMVASGGLAALATPGAPPCCGSPPPTCASGCTPSTISPTACCASFSAAITPPRARACPRTPSSWPARWDLPHCSTTTASACAGSCWRRADQPPTWRTGRARSALPPAVESPTPPARA